MDTPPAISSPAWNTTTKRTVALIVLLLAGLLFMQFTSALPMVIVALILAYLLYPLTNLFNLRLRTPRGLAVLLTFISAVLLLTVVLLVVVPALARQFADFARNFPGFVISLERQLETFLSQPLTFNNQPVLIDGQPFVPLDQLRDALGTQDVVPTDNIDLGGVLQTIASSAASLTRPAFTFVGGAFNAVINLIFFLTMLFYLLKDGGVFVASILGMVPEGYQGDARRLFYELGEVWNGYLRGQLILCLFIGVMVTLAGLVLGIPNAPVLGLISGVMEFIPIIGPGIALIPAVLLGLVSQSSTLPFLSGVGFAVTVALVWTVIQNIQAIIVTPRVMGDSLDLHPFVILLAVLVGSSFGGVLGVILAAPFAATLRLGAHYVYAKLTDQDPFPPKPDKPAPLPAWWVRLRAWWQARAARRPAAPAPR